jgi:membrane associated rhomboid family serine protease
MKPSDLRHNLVAMSRVKAPFAVAFVLAAVHLMITLLGTPERINPIYQFFGLQWEAFIGGRVWQLLTYGFLHGGGFHLGVNMIGILMIGSRVEHILGSRRFLRICLLGIISGGVAHLLVTPGGAGAPILVGFSATVMALLLLLTTLSPESRMWPLPVSGRSLGLGILFAEGILALIDPSLGLPLLSQAGIWIAKYGGAAWFEIAHGCHFGGGLAGWVYGRWILRQRVTLKSLRRARERREAG